MPTPGQTEQEYLAAYLMKQNMFFCVLQKDFSINGALQKSAAFNFTELSVPQDQYKKIIKEFTQQLK